MRLWLNVELNKANSEKFRGVLRDKGVRYIISGMGEGWVYFEVLCSDEEREILNDFLSTL